MAEKYAPIYLRQVGDTLLPCLEDGTILKGVAKVVAKCTPERICAIDVTIHHEGFLDANHDHSDWIKDIHRNEPR